MSKVVYLVEVRRENAMVAYARDLYSNKVLMLEDAEEAEQVAKARQRADQENEYRVVKKQQA